MVNNEQLRAEFSARLNQALDDAGVRKRGRAADVAEAMTRMVEKVSPIAARKWLKAEAMPGPAFMRGLSLWLNRREEWLEYGRPEPDNLDAPGIQGSPLFNQLVSRLKMADMEGTLTQKLAEHIFATIDLAAPSTPTTGDDVAPDFIRRHTIASVHEGQDIAKNKDKHKEAASAGIKAIRDSKKAADNKKAMIKESHK